VNIGGDPGRDDFGLPPIDIEIPDDARELEHDIQAYHRELRALRWRRRTGRLAVPLTRDGLVLPLLAGCLALTLLAGTLLTVFSSTEMTPPSLGRPGHQLPDAIVLVNGQDEPLSDLYGSVLALVPAQCKCGHLRQLAAEADRAGVQLYIVGTNGAQVAGLAHHTGLGAYHAVQDTEGALGSTYRPVTLTAVMVKANGSVAKIVRDRGQGFALVGAMRTLVPATTTPGPSGTSMASVAASPAGS
jgi:hypothetical protein